MPDVTTATATVIKPKVQDGTELFAAQSSLEPQPGAQPKSAPSGKASDTEAIAQAVIRHLRGDATGALEVLQSVDEDSRTPDLLAALGHIQTDLDYFEAAAQTYSDLVQKQPRMAEAWFQLGFCQYRLGQAEQALQQFEKAGTLRTDWIEIPLAKAICQLKLKQYEAAFVHADECLAIDPAYAPALFAKAVTYHVMWDFDEASVLYRRIVDVDPKSMPALMNLITLGLQQKQYDMVRRYSEQLIALQPDAALAVEGIAISAFNDGDYATAEQQFSRLIELIPDQVANWLNFGLSCERQGKLSEAVAAYTRARLLRQDSLYAHTYLGGALWKSGDLASARVCYEQAVEKWPDREDLTLSLAQILEDLGNFDGSEKVCVAFCKRDAGRKQVWFRLGYLQFKRRAWDETIRSFERALSLKSDYPDAEVNLALAYYMAAQYEESEAVLQRLLDREPEHLEGLKGLATVAFAQGRHQDALHLHEKTLQVAGPDADTYYNCGVLAHSLSDPRRAVEYYREAIARRPAFAEALLNLGHALTELGDGTEAQKAWISALELRPEFARGYFRRT